MNIGFNWQSVGGCAGMKKGAEVIRQQCITEEAGLL